jgi:hypothetical protein
MQPLGNQANAAPKLHFKAPEGRYELVGERLSGLCAFSASRAPRLTLAELPGGEEAGAYLVFSIQDALNICRFTESAKVPCIPCSAGVSPARPPLRGEDWLCASGDGTCRRATAGAAELHQLRRGRHRGHGGAAHQPRLHPGGGRPRPAGGPLHGRR